MGTGTSRNADGGLHGGEEREESLDQAGGQLYVSLKMENYKKKGDLIPHIYGSVPLVGSWDSTKALSMERESASMWELSFVVPPNHETLDFKFLLKPKHGYMPCIVEEGPNRLLTGGTLQGDARHARLALFKLDNEEVLEYRVFIKADRVSPFDLAASWRAYQDNLRPSTVRGIPDVSINAAPETGHENGSSASLELDLEHYVVPAPSTSANSGLVYAANLAENPRSLTSSGVSGDRPATRKEMEFIIPDPSKVYSGSGMVESKSVGTFSPLQKQDSHRGLFVDRGVGSPRLVKSSSSSTFSFDLKLDSKNKNSMPAAAGAVAAAAVADQMLGPKEDRHLAIVLVGLPARGKTFTAVKLTRYLRWLGHDTKHFNVGKYRRLKHGTNQSADFFRADNPEGMEARNEVAALAMDDMIAWMQEGGQVGIFDATNSSRSRRNMLMKMAEGRCKIIFLETICNDERIIERNIRLKIQQSPDYAEEPDFEAGLQDFTTRLANYEKVYEPVDEGSYIKMIDMASGHGGQIQVNNMSGYLPGRIVFFLVNTHLTPRPILLTRHGESRDNVRGRIGGDSVLSDTGEIYMKKLANFVEKRLKSERTASIWTSTLQRTILTASPIVGFPKIQWRALDEINAGVCDGMTYEEIKKNMPEEYESRKKDKLRYRYPRGESYLDVIQRLEPVIIELERQRAPVVVISHQAVLRALYAYFADRPLKEIPHIEVPLHTIIEIQMGVTGVQEKRYDIFKSLPSVTNNEMTHSSRVQPADDILNSGIWDLTDDILINVLAALGPKDLTRVAATCQHLRSLAALIMPCMKLKLFPHQQAAVEWMLRRERNADVLRHPLYMEFSTEDGFPFYINSVVGSIVTGTAPTIRDFRGGMFCDEPGLGKTITSLSLILKTQGTMADPPDGVQIIWCTHNGNDKCGYYELRGDKVSCNNMTSGKRTTSLNVLRGQSSLGKLCLMEDINYPLPKRPRLMSPGERSAEFDDSCSSGRIISPSAPHYEPLTWAVRSSRNLAHIRKNLLYAYDGLSGSCKGKTIEKNMPIRNGSRHVYRGKPVDLSFGVLDGCMRAGKGNAGRAMCTETWVQCDSCHKWRKLVGSGLTDAKVAWFCSMNTDPARQSCTDPEEAWDKHESITYLPGFFTKGTAGGKEENVSFFMSVLKEHHDVINSKTKKALLWLAKLSPERLSEMETVGLSSPILGSGVVGDALGFHKIFQAFGLIKREEKGIIRWYYPRTLENLAFDLGALRLALCEPLDSVRLYLSRATLVVVPSNLVDHWKTQIQKHVRLGQLQLYVWTDHRKPPVHNLAWDYDIVITTFNRLSAEWGPRKRSALMQVHWFRVILDEGHTLGSSLNLTNKLQMAISLTASSRWLLTGTPTRNTPNSQLSHLQPLLKFLHEEAYGQNQKSWEAGILKPFEAKMEEGRSRLLQLLRRCMISARKIDLQNIPPCIKKVTFVNFTDEHARSYNELVVTVRRNILMADWNDPSHVESLLNPKQWKFRSTTIRNVRLSCCVAGQIKVTEAGEDIQETMDILVETGLDPLSEEYAFIKYNLLYGGNCQRCNEWCRLPIVTPCRHLLCLDCVGLDSKMCTLPGCGHLYEMQTPETLARPENPNPKWPVPKDLIELQPSYKQDDWNPDWQSTSSSKVAYLVERLKALQEVNKEVRCSMDEDDKAKHIDKFLCPSQRSDMGVPLLLNLSRLGNESCNMLPEKVLIFSQFLEHIHVIEQQLTFAGIKFAGMYSPMHSGNKMKSLAMFQYDDSCMALLMDGSAALGLDLSFVTHVFLMEPIWDRSMEEQVISRAHRMGATRPIHVETLAMRGTIEEQMMEFLQDADACRKFLKEESQRSGHDGSRPCRTLHDFAESNYLARLSFAHRNSVS